MTVYTRVWRASVFVLLAGLVAGGCSDDPARPTGGSGGPPPPTITWDQLRGGLGAGDIRSMWGSSPQQAFALSAQHIFHFDGKDWKLESLPPLPGDLNAVSGVSAELAFAVGDAGTILRWNGKAWILQTSPTPHDLRDVCAVSASDAYAVSAASPAATELLHYDGHQWTVIATRDGVRANAVFALPGLAFLAGDAGWAAHHDVTGLHDDDTFIAEDLHDLWGSSAADVYAVGDLGRMLHYDGSAWAPVFTGTTGALRSIDGASPSSIDAVGDRGRLLHYDGSSWGTTPPLSDANLYAVAALDGTLSTAGGEFGTILSGHGTQWASSREGQPFAFESVWSAFGYFMAVAPTPAGGVARDRDGYSWEFPTGLHAISGFNRDDLFAAGDAGTMYHFDGVTWTPVAMPSSATLRSLTALVSRFGQPFRLYAVGDDGTLLVLRAGTWIVAQPPAGAEDYQFVDVWAASIDDVFAVACNATSLVRYDDPYELGGWTLESTPATAPLLAVGGWLGDVYIASAAGEIFFNPGNGWTPMPSPVMTPLRDVRALAENSIFACGDAGTILHFDGVAWRKTITGFPGTFNALWGAPDRDVFAVGTEGAVFVHRD
ncbi:MAG TPA: hypothetical protein VFX92_14305 [Candidatus Krumholzibacteria bacterium]|nr:hypothetical protein [Candidatus Krumholzibacteria bacterium]